MVNVYDYIGSGFTLVKLHKFNDDNSCGCGEPSCNNAGKHPSVNWRNLKNDNASKSFEVIEQETINDDKNGAFNHGFAVLCDGFLIVDVDKKNGGFESLEHLNNSLGYRLQDITNFKVKTGGGGYHFYFKYSSEPRLKKNLPAFKGIDFLSAGSIVVGCGSRHKSGAYYEEVTDKHNTGLSELTEAPAELTNLLECTIAAHNPLPPLNQHKSNTNKYFEIENLLSGITGDFVDDYDSWIKVGATLKNELGDAGFELWVNWSKQSHKAENTNFELKWNTFDGIGSATIKSLQQMATDSGYEKPITFIIDDSAVSYTPAFTDIFSQASLEDRIINERKERELEKPIRPNIPLMDIRKPTGLVGEMVDYINSCCLYPREYLAVGGAFTALSIIAGVNTVDPFAGTNKPNVMFFGVAGSGTGKNSIFSATQNIISTVGFASCLSGKIKSEQELGRNIVRDQVNAYIIDEVGDFLIKVTNSGASAPYLSAILAEIMTIYCQSGLNGLFSPSGDVPVILIEELSKKISILANKIEECDNDMAKILLELRLQDCKETLEEVQRYGGFKSPFISLLGFTVPATFQAIMTQKHADDGFIARSIILEEKDDNPMWKNDFKPPKSMPESLHNKLIDLATNGCYSANDQCYDIRVKQRGEIHTIITDKGASDLLNEIRLYLWNLTNWHKENTGFTAILRRSFEMITKISALMSIGNTYVRTLEHVQYAFNLIEYDLRTKIGKLESSVTKGDPDSDAIAKILSIVSDTVPMSIYEIHRKGVSKDRLEVLIPKLVQQGMLEERNSSSKKGRKSVRYCLVNN